MKIPERAFWTVSKVFYQENFILFHIMPLCFGRNSTSSKVVNFIIKKLCCGFPFLPFLTNSATNFGNNETFCSFRANLNASERQKFKNFEDECLRGIGYAGNPTDIELLTESWWSLMTFPYACFRPNKHNMNRNGPIIRRYPRHFCQISLFMNNSLSYS